MREGAALPEGLDSAAVWEVLERAAAAAAVQTLSHFRTAIEVENKAAFGFDPVTEADRAAERAIREVIAKAFPEHGVVGEELSDSPADSRFTWVIDPIDGTRAYVSGLPLWGTLIGLTHAGRAIAGLMSQPFIGETFAAVGGVGRAERAGSPFVLRTSSVDEIGAARLATTTPVLFASKASSAAYRSVERAARIARYGTDCYGYCMLASGHIDLVIEEGLKAVDIVALIPIIEAAGGVVSNWKGGRAEAGGQIVAAATLTLHAQVLGLLAPGAS